MKKLLLTLTACVLTLSLAACGGTTGTTGNVTGNATGNANRENSVTTQPDESNPITVGSTESGGTETMSETKRVASDGAQMQTNDPSMPTRVLEEGTKINMHFGDTIIPGILNDSTTAQALLEKLPLTVRENKYSHDFCGSMGESLPFDEADERYG